MGELTVDEDHIQASAMIPHLAAPARSGGTENILGYAVANTGAEGCVLSVLEWIRTGDRCRWLACINPHSYAVARKEERLAEALRDADWLIPDGAGIVLASRMLKGTIRRRVTGSDVFRSVSAALEREGSRSVFFLGSTEETLVLLRERMKRDFPNVRVAGTRSPPFAASFSSQESEAMIRAINDARPDVLWVGMTAPKQELWISEHRHRLQVRFAAAVGAVFDFYSGRVKRSHPVVQRIGLEWLPRLARQPRRLWRRTFLSAPRFLLDVLRVAVGRGQSQVR